MAVAEFGLADDLARRDVEGNDPDRLQVAGTDVQNIANQQAAHQGELYDGGTQVQDFRRLWLGAQKGGRRRRLAGCQPDGRGE
ncbi:hypothetical protein D3C73_1132540 [compost metagenome]